MSNTAPTSRGVMPRTNPKVAARHQDPSHGAACRRQACRRASGASTAAGRATAGPNAQRAGRAKPGRLDLFLGHFGTHTRGTGVKRDVNLLSLTHGNPHNNGAAPGAAQGRGGRVRGVARDLAQCPDGRRPAGLPGWAHSLGCSAGAACGARSVTRHGNPGRAPCPPDSARSGLQGAAQPQAPVPLRQWSPLEALPRQALSDSRAFGEGVPHG